MKTEPAVSVIIAAFNGEAYIQRAIDSALCQSGVDCEVIVVDDGSTDHTYDRVAAYGDKVRLIRKENGGSASARNAGVSAAQGQYIAILDQDDVFLPDKLSKQVMALESNPGAVICHGNIRMIDSQGEFIENGHLGHDPANPPVSGNVTKELFKWNFVLNCTTLIRRDALLKAGGFNESLWGTEDYECWMRLSLLGDVVYLNDIVSYYRWHESNSSRDEFRMMLGRLSARNAFLNSVPEAKSALGADFIRNVILKYVFNFSYPLYKNGRGREARQLLRLGLQLYPAEPKLWKMYFVSYFHR